MQVYPVVVGLLLSFSLISKAHAEKTFEQKNRARYQCIVESFDSVYQGRPGIHSALIGDKITVLESRAHFADWLAIGDPIRPRWNTAAFSMGNHGTISETENVYLFTFSGGIIFVDLLGKSGRYYYKNDFSEETIRFKDCKKLPFKY